MHKPGQTKCVLAAFAAGVLMPSTLMASAIVAPHGAGRDADLAGVVVASPDDGASALLVNPAGVVSEARDQVVLAFLPFNFSASYQNDASGYHGASSKTPIGINLWYGLGQLHGWSLGAGIYGSVGTAFEFPSDPDIGQTSGYTGKLSIVNFGLNLGRELTSDLRFGVQLAPRFGRQKVRTPSPLGDVAFEVDGAGLSASLGFVWDPAESLSVGLAYRSPGFVDMEGDGSVGGVDQDVEVDFITPQSVTLGMSYQWSEKLDVLWQTVWTDYQDFERGDVEFQTTTALNQPVIAATRNRVRWGIGFEYQLMPNSWLRGGFTSGQAMIKDEALRPTLFDHDNDMLMLGYEIDYGRFMVGFTTGYMHLDKRSVDAGTNPFAPGTYRSKSDVSAGLRVTWRIRSGQERAQ